MSYTNTIPTQNQSLGVTQPLIFNNFNTIQTTFDVNHVDFNTATDFGKHKFLQMPIQGSSPATLPAATAELALFAAVIGGTNVFAMREAANGVVYALTGITPAAVLNGFTPLIGSVLLQWGSVVTTATSGTQNFNTPFPTSCFVVITQPFSGNTIPNSQATFDILNAGGFPSTTQFKWALVTNSGSYTGFYWMAIGN